MVAFWGNMTLLVSTKCKGRLAPNPEKSISMIDGNDAFKIPGRQWHRSVVRPDTGELIVLERRSGSRESFANDIAVVVVY